MRSIGSMKIVEMLKLSEMGLSQRQIAASSGCGKTTVGDVLKLCREKSVTYTLAVSMDEAELHATLYPESVNDNAKTQSEPDWAAIHAELVKHKNLNLQFMWEEYRAATPDGLGYSSFCKRYRAYREKTGRKVTLHQERRAGELMEVDWMGDTLDCVVDPESGELLTAHFFVAVLGYSELPYVEAFPNEQEPNWIAANVNALHYYGGVPRIIVPDNVKTAVKTPKYYEPVINSAYWEFAEHYEVAVVPARSRKPKDKAAVEESVGWLETWLLGKLRNQRFFSFAELNRAIMECVKELSKKPFQKREGSRRSNFEGFDKPALKPLPTRKFEIADVVLRRVVDNYHLEYDGFYYSVPYTLYGEQVVLRATGTTIEVIDKTRTRVASHIRRYTAVMGRYVSNEEHMPPNHRAVYRQRQFDGKRYRDWAKKIGENTYFIIDALLTSHRAPEQSYKSCMAILQFSKSYGEDRLESACAKARTLGSCTYSTVKGILKNGALEPASSAPAPTPSHENIRGSEYYN